MGGRWMALLATAGALAVAQTAAGAVQFGPPVDVPVDVAWSAMALVGPGIADPNDGGPGVPIQRVALLTGQLAPPSVTVVALRGTEVVGLPRRGSLPAADRRVMTTADLDGDGRREVLVASSGPDEVSVFEVPDGPGPLPDRVSVATGPSPGRPVVGELTGDTHADVAVITTAGLEILPGDGAGGLGASQLAVPTATLVADSFGFLTGQLAAGDLTGDGRAELVVAINRPLILSASQTLLRVLAAGTFAPIGDPVTAIGGLQTMELADVDGDGRLDRVLAGLSIGQIRLGFGSYTPFGSVEFGTGLGGFGGGIGHISGGGGDIYRNPPDPIGTVVADLDLDGVPDLLSAPGRVQGGPPELEARMVLAGRQLSAAQPVSVPTATSEMAVADVTGNGVPDIVTAGSQPKTLAVVPALTGVAGRPLEFGDLRVGEGGPALQLPITNSGAGTLAVAGVRLAGEAAGDFRVSGDACTGRTLAAGEDCALTLAFRPTAAGRREARVEVGLADGRTFEVPVSGTGTPAPAAPTPTTPGAGTNATRPPAVRARCTVRRASARTTVTCRASFRARPGLKVAIRLVRGGRVYAKADIRRGGRVKLRVLRPLPLGRFTVVTVASLPRARQTRQPLVVRGG